MRINFGLATLLLGCSNTISPGYTVSYDSIGDGVRSSGSRARNWSLCEIALETELGGFYRVDSMTGVYEEFPRGSGEFNGYTYVELSVIDGWSANAADFTARIFGGPVDAHTTAAHFITLAVGDEFGAMPWSASSDNAGFPNLSGDRMFHRTTSGELDNGSVRAPEDQVVSIAARAIDTGVCDVDVVPPNYRPPREPVPDNVQDSPDAGTSD